ncbi:MAG: 50S ribosomal protein L21 [Chloroflexota bacterium]
MYAVIVSGGSQYRVTEGDLLDVASLSAEVGSTVELDKVLMVQNDGEASIGKPYVEGAKVSATVESHGRGKKVIVYKHKKNYKRKQGHRQGYTRLKIDKIEL